MVTRDVAVDATLSSFLEKQKLFIAQVTWYTFI